MPVALAISRDLFHADADYFYREVVGYAELDANEGYGKNPLRGRREGAVA